MAQNPEQRAFADTTIGKIAIGAAIGLIGAAISFAVARYTLVLTPPNAVLQPEKATVTAGEIIEFSAAGSSDPDGGALRYGWTLGGLPFADSAVAQCTTRADDSLAICRFAAPGTFALGLRVVSESELEARAVASIKVTIENGYIGILLQGSDTDDAYRELLYGVDWVAVQALSPRPIVLFDPDSDAPVFALSFIGTTAQRAIKRPTGALAGRKIMLAGFPRKAAAALEFELIALGAATAQIPFGEVAMAMQAGVADGASVGFDSLEELQKLIAEQGD